MELFRHELKKILFNRKSFLILAVLVLIPVVTNIASSLSYYGENGNAYAMNERYKPYEGVIREDLAEIAQKEVDRISEMRVNDPKSYDSYSKLDKTFYFDYCNASDMAYWYTNGRFKSNRAADDSTSNPRSLAGVTEKVRQLEVSGDKASYEYRQHAMQLEMLKAAGTPGFYYNSHWKALFSFLAGGGPIFLIMLLLLLAAPVFSREYSTGMDSIIFSSRKGRGRIMAAKTAASLTVCVIAVLLFNLVQFVCYIAPGAFINRNAPLNSLYAFFTTPYSISLLDYFLLHVAYQLAGGMVLTLVALFFSSRFKSTLVSFFTGMCFALYPSILYGLLGIRTDWMRVVRDISVESALRPGNLFDGFFTYNLFGVPVLLPYIVIAAIALFGMAAAMLTYSGFKRRDAC